MDENLPNKIDHLFNQRLHKFKSDPSEEVWNKIENRLNKEDRKIAWFGWKRYIAMAVLLIAGLSVLMKVYFPGATIFTHSLPKQEKGQLPSAVVPKTDAQESGPSRQTHLVKIDHQKNNAGLHNSISDKDVKISGGKIQKTALVNNFLSGHRVFILTPEFRLQSFQINPPALQMHKPEENPLAVISQKKRIADRFSITPYFSKEFAGYSLADDDLTGPNGQEIEERERNVFSASVGFYINYKISKKWVLQSGISYSWSNSDIDSSTSYAVKVNPGNVQYKLNTMSGYGYLKPTSSIQPNVGDSVSTGKSYSQLHYLSIPLVLSYRIPLKRFSLLVGAGASFNILTGAEIETRTYGNGNPEKEYCVNLMGLKKINYGMIVKLDLEYHLNSRIGVEVMPCFKNTLSPINLQSSVAAYPYNFGIGVGMTYRF